MLKIQLISSLICVSLHQYQHAYPDLKIPFFTAQKLGLVEAPELLLSDKEWKKIKEKSNARQDSSQPCVICKEDFGLQQQVTTCSHHHVACQVDNLEINKWMHFFKKISSLQDCVFFCFWHVVFGEILLF